MKDYCWDHDNMEAIHQSMLSEVIADPSGMINVDSSEFANPLALFANIVGGAAGKVENCLLSSLQKPAKNKI